MPSFFLLRRTRYISELQEQEGDKRMSEDWRCQEQIDEIIKEFVEKLKKYENIEDKSFYRVDYINELIEEYEAKL